MFVGFLFIAVSCGLPFLLEWLMPGSTTLRMTTQEERAARNWPPVFTRDVTIARIIMLVILGVMLFGLSRFPWRYNQNGINEFEISIALVLFLSYVVFGFWYPWMKRGKTPYPLATSTKGRAISGHVGTGQPEDVGRGSSMGQIRGSTVRGQHEMRDYVDQKVWRVFEFSIPLELW